MTSSELFWDFTDLIDATISTRLLAVPDWDGVRHTLVPSV